jgi:hypothetical protein
MELLKQPQTGKGPAGMFAGDVWFDVIYRGEEPSRARANMVKFAAGEEHWHGAAPGRFMIHLALREYPGPDGAPENTWLEHVTEAEYNGPRVSTRH